MYVFMCKEYDSVIKDQIERGIVEVVNEETKPDIVHYIPHHAAIRRDKTTTKLRIVYDASAKSDGASLNDVFMPVLRLHKVSLTLC